MGALGEFLMILFTVPAVFYPIVAMISESGRYVSGLYLSAHMQQVLSVRCSQWWR